jgi:hypothetical protein
MSMTFVSAFFALRRGPGRASAIHLRQFVCSSVVAIAFILLYAFCSLVQMMADTMGEVVEPIVICNVSPAMVEEVAHRNMLTLDHTTQGYVLTNLITYEKALLGPGSWSLRFSIDDFAFLWDTGAADEDDKITEIDKVLSKTLFVDDKSNLWIDAGVAGKPDLSNLSDEMVLKAVALLF